jgi:hypothetical protein
MNIMNRAGYRSTISTMTACVAVVIAAPPAIVSPRSRN